MPCRLITLSWDLTTLKYDTRLFSLTQFPLLFPLILSSMGSIFFKFLNLFDQSYPPKSKFSTDQIPDLTGRVVIVTGESESFNFFYAFIDPFTNVSRRREFWGR